MRHCWTVCPNSLPTEIIFKDEQLINSMYYITCRVTGRSRERKRAGFHCVIRSDKCKYRRRKGRKRRSPRRRRQAVFMGYQGAKGYSVVGPIFPASRSEFLTKAGFVLTGRSRATSRPFCAGSRLVEPRHQEGGR